jgi:hypothetical protein
MLVSRVIMRGLYVYLFTLYGKSVQHRITNYTALQGQTLLSPSCVHFFLTCHALVSTLFIGIFLVFFFFFFFFFF